MIGKHLSGMLLYTAVEGDCARMGCISEIGAPLVAAHAVALGALLLIPRGVAERDRAMQLEKERAEAARAAAEKATRDAESGQLREENRVLRERLDALEAKIAELLRDTEGK